MQASLCVVFVNMLMVINNNSDNNSNNNNNDSDFGIKCFDFSSTFRLHCADGHWHEVFRDSPLHSSRSCCPQRSPVSR